MADNNLNESYMPVFIQTMYGAIIGVGSLKLTSFEIDYWPVDIKATIAFTAAFAFGFVLLFFTIMIAAHDWYSFHLIKRTPGEKPYTFWAFVPQIGALFFLAQMILAAHMNALILWYSWGLLYTICNIIKSAHVEPGQMRNQLGVKYRWHLAICIVPLLLLYITRSDLVWLNWTLLILTIVVVFFLWYKLDKLYINDQVQSNVGKGETP